jgi:hypothetical protein
MYAIEKPLATILITTWTREVGAGVPTIGYVLPIPRIIIRGLASGILLLLPPLGRELLCDAFGVSPRTGELAIDNPIIVAPRSEAGSDGRLDAMPRPFMTGYQCRAVNDIELASRRCHELCHLRLVEEEVQLRVLARSTHVPLAVEERVRRHH